MVLHKSRVAAAAAAVIGLSAATRAAFLCHADVNCSGSVDAGDLVTVIESWGPCEGCSADLDGDGIVAVDDLIAVLISWGDCVTGACCTTDGCVDTHAALCASGKDVYFGDGTTCADVECPQGACCVFGGCFNTTVGFCDYVDGIHLAGVFCCDASCDPPVSGACCVDCGVCYKLCPISCGNIGGTYLGVGSECSDCP